MAHYNHLSNETLITFAKIGQDTSAMTYNQKRRAGAARAELNSRDFAAGHGE